MMSTEMDEQVNPLERDHSLCVIVPGRVEEKTMVHGSKPVMDLLVTLCASYHLNPSDYTVEFLSPNKNSISFKPNSPVGLLEAEKIVLKLKGSEEKVKRPYMPEATVRLLINYNKAHRTVVRVNPRLPLETLLQLVCDKCEFNVETTILLRDSQSQEPLDLKKTLNDHGLREVFAKDMAAKSPSDHQLQTAEAAGTTAEASSPSPLQDLPKKGKKGKSRGFFSLFRRRKKINEMHQTVSAPASPGFNKQVGVAVSSESTSATNTLRTDTSKKRRAPPPPVAVSHSVPNDLSSCHIKGAQKSAESTLRSTKRRAPPPPCANILQELRKDTDVGESVKTVEELKENELHVEDPSSSSSPHPSQPLPSLSSWRQSLAHLHEESDLHLPSFRGKDLCDARCALAKVLTSSVSKGALVKRFRNSATFPKFNVSSCVSTTPDNEDLCAELESVFSSNLPTAEWEDPLQRSGVTTFKVVPSKKPGSCNPELTVDGLDQLDQSHVSTENDRGSKSSPEVEKDQLENKKDLSSPDTLEGESPEESSQQNQMNDLTPSPPPQHDLEVCLEETESLSEVEDANKEQEEEEEPDIRSAVIPSDCNDRGVSPDSNDGGIPSDCHDGEVPSDCNDGGVPSDSNDGEVPSEGHVNLEDQREFNQSPIADMDPCSSCAGEKKAEEDVLHKEEKEEEEVSFPPPPPPVFFKEDNEVIEKTDSTASSFQPESPSLNGQEYCTDVSEAHADKSTSGMSEQPVDKKNNAPSKFAQAVAMAVQRSRLQSLSQRLGPQSALQSPPRSTYQYGA